MQKMLVEFICREIPVVQHVSLDQLVGLDSVLDEVEVDLLIRVQERRCDRRGANADRRRAVGQSATASEGAADQPMQAERRQQRERRPEEIQVPPAVEDGGFEENDCGNGRAETDRGKRPKAQSRVSKRGRPAQCAANKESGYSYAAKQQSERRSRDQKPRRNVRCRNVIRENRRSTEQFLCDDKVTSRLSERLNKPPCGVAP